MYIVISMVMRKSTYLILWELPQDKHGENYFGECVMESTP